MQNLSFVSVNSTHTMIVSVRCCLFLLLLWFNFSSVMEKGFPLTIKPSTRAPHPCPDLIIFGFLVLQCSLHAPLFIFTFSLIRYGKSWDCKVQLPMGAWEWGKRAVCNYYYFWSRRYERAKYTTLISTILHSPGMEAKRRQRRNKEREETKGKRETEERSSTDTQTDRRLSRYWFVGY